MKHKMNVYVRNSNWLSDSSSGTSLSQQMMVVDGVLDNKDLCNISILTGNIYLGDILYYNGNRIHIYKNLTYTLDFSIKDIDDT